MNNLENFNPYNGFIKGNLFESTYIPYKNYLPFQFNPKNEKDYLRLLVQIYGFSFHEMNLYLETNPDDKNALMIRDNFYSLYLDAVSKFQNKYGSFYLDNSNIFDWPWEVN